MKISLILSFVITVLMISCKKKHTCVCDTNSTTTRVYNAGYPSETSTYTDHFMASSESQTEGEFIKSNNCYPYSTNKSNTYLDYTDYVKEEKTCTIK